MIKLMLNPTDRLELLLDAISEAVFAVNKDHLITIINRPAETLFGVKEKDVIGKPAGDLFTLHDENNQIMRLVNLTNNTPQRFENLHVTINGTKHFVNLHVEDIRSKSNGIEYIFTITDITKIKILEKTKDEFLSVASHELRTPMTIIKSYLWMVNSERHGQLSEKQREYIKKAILSTERMIKLINDFLNISKIEENKVDFTITRTDIVELINELLIDLRVKAGEKGLHLNQINKKDKVYVYVDTSKLREIILNLVGNAIKFTASGKVDVVIDEVEDFAKIEVIDTGIGLKEAEIKRLFHKFGRLDNSFQTVAEAGGTGLGLYIVKMYVENMSGQIGVSSEGKGKGSCFWFTLPTKTPYTKNK